MNQTPSRQFFRAAVLALSAPLWVVLSGCAGAAEDPENSSPIWGTEWQLLAIGEQHVAMGAQATLLLKRAESVSSRWRLIALGNDAAENPKKRTLEHLQYGQISGNGSCNRFSASASIDVYHLQVGNIASTKMACSSEAMSQETRYLDALQKARTYEIEKNHLLIRTSDTAHPLRFSRIK